MSDLQRSHPTICRASKLFTDIKHPKPDYFILKGPLQVINGEASLHAQLIQKMGALNPYDDLISMCNSYFEKEFVTFMPSEYIMDYISLNHTLKKGIYLEFFTSYSFKVVFLSSHKISINEVHDTVSTIEKLVTQTPGLFTFLPFQVFFQIENDDVFLMTLNFKAGEEKSSNVRTVTIA